MSDNDDPSKISDEQQIVVLVVRICSASLSILGSGTLAFKILRDRARNNGCTTPYNRMMLGLSASDIFASLTWIIRIFLYQRGSRVWAFGNATACQANGFLVQVSRSAIWYNGLLSYFFLLRVLSQVRQKDYVQKAEPWLHFSALFWPITAFAGLFLGWYTEACQLADVTIGLYLLVIPILFVALSIIVNYPTIYCIVRKSLRSAEHVAGRIDKEATTQMILYVVGIVACIAPSFVSAAVQLAFGYEGYDKEMYPLRILSSLLYPIQGFFNFFIFIKPVYARFREAYPNKSRLFVLQQAILKSKPPSLQHRKEANHITHTSDVVITDIISTRETDPNDSLFSSSIRQLSSLRDPSNQPDSASREGQTQSENTGRENPSDQTTSPEAAETLDGATNT